MTRLLALCLLLFGLAIQLAPMSVAVAPGMADVISMPAMDDCADCDGGPMAMGEACAATAACMAPPAALQTPPPVDAFEPRARGVPRRFDDPTRSGARPAPMLEPPRAFA